MDRNTNFLSELEAELESEFDSEQGTENEYNTDSELDNELDNEYEFESDNEFELEYDNEYEFESESDNEFELEYDGGNGRSYESRIYRLLSRSGDNELEFDQELNQVIYEMEQEFFFKGLKKLAKKGLQKFKSIAGRTPLGQVINTATSLARGNIRNALRKAAGLALRSGAGFIPGGALIAPMATRALNLETASDQEISAKKAKNLVQLAQQSYQNLAQQVDPRMANPGTANAMARLALKKAMAGISQNGKNGHRKNGVVVHISSADWNKVKNGGNLIIKVKQG